MSDLRTGFDTSALSQLSLLPKDGAFLGLSKTVTGSIFVLRALVGCKPGFCLSLRIFDCSDKAEFSLSLEH